MADKTLDDIKQGDEVWLADGTPAEYVAGTSRGHVVRPLIQGDDDEGFFGGEVVEVASVFGTEPTSQFKTELGGIIAQIEAKRQELAELRSKAATEERAVKDRLAKLAKFAALSRLEDYLEGKFTHFVFYGDYDRIRIQDKEAALAQDDRFDKKTRLLTLFGDSGGNLQWKLNQYRDGSGNWMDCQPCCSEQEARTFMAGLLDKVWAQFDIDGKASWRLQNACDSAYTYGFSVPAKVMEAARQEKIASAASQVASAQKELDERKAKLFAIEQGK